MIKAIRSHLGLKLFLTYMVVILVTMFMLTAATQVSLPRAFFRHMQGMRMGMGANMPGGDPLVAEQANLYINFRAGFNYALRWAGLAATILALGVSVALSRGVVAPVKAMMSASKSIAEGHYQERVKVTNIDELGQLAEHFNEMAGKLEQVEARRRQLIGDVAHELRTPLTTIKGSMEGLMDGVLPPTAETYQQILNESERLNRLVDDLQELSRVESGAYKLDLQPMRVQDLVHTTVKRLQRAFDEKGVSLSAKLPANLPQVEVDEGRLEQVLLNLVGNALNYTPEGGQVQVSATHSGREVAISVRDTGIGIAAEHLDNIFDRFYRVDKSRSRKAGAGSGIGLTIARALVEAHGGRIQVESAGEGQGSTFTFSLPVSG